MTMAFDDDDFDVALKHGEMPPILSSHYRWMFQLFQSRARALTRIEQGWPRERDEALVEMVNGQAEHWGLTAREFGFVDPPSQAATPGVTWALAITGKERPC